MGTQLPKKKGYTIPTQFLAHVYCGQTAGLIKTPLGTEIDLGSGHIVLDGVLAPHERGTASPAPSFRPMSIVATVAHLSFCGAVVQNCNVGVQCIVAKRLNGSGYHLVRR